MCVYTKKRTVTEFDYDRSIWAYLLEFKSELVNFQSTVKTEHVARHESRIFQRFIRVGLRRVYDFRGAFATYPCTRIVPVVRPRYFYEINFALLAHPALTERPKWIWKTRRPQKRGR